MIKIIKHQEIVDDVEGEVKCKECGNDIVPKIEGIDLCAKCDEKNWISDPVEIQKAILQDPELKNLVEHQLPYEKI